MPGGIQGQRHDQPGESNFQSETHKSAPQMSAHAETNPTFSAITASGYHHHSKDRVSYRVGGYGKLLPSPGVRKGPELQSLEGADLLAKSDELKDAAASIFKAGRPLGRHGRLPGVSLMKHRLSLSWLKIMMNHAESWMISAIGDMERMEGNQTQQLFGKPTTSGVVGLWSHRYSGFALASEVYRRHGCVFES